MIISSREMKNFHMENKTHFKTKEQKGTELEFSDTLSAPFDIKIYGASGQRSDYMICKGGTSFDGEEIKPEVAAGTYNIITLNKKYSVELPGGLYAVGDACDKLIFNRLTDKLVLKKEIDESLLDPSKTIEENTQAILKVPTYTELTLTSIGFSNIKADLLPWNVYGKNYFSTRNMSYIQGQTTFSIWDGGFKQTINKTTSSIGSVTFRLLLDTGVYKLTFYATCTNTGDEPIGKNRIIMCTGYPSGGTYLASESFTPSGDCVNKKCSYRIARNSGGFLTIAFYACPSGAVFTDYSMLIENIMLEKYDEATDEYEPYNPNPPESLIPSKDYPSEIIPLKNITIKCTNGDIVKESEIEASLYETGGVSDSIEFDSKSGQTYFISRINPEKLDGTKPLSEQGAALRSEPLITEVETALKGFRAIQGGCSVLATGYIGEEEKNAYIEAKVKVLK